MFGKEQLIASIREEAEQAVKSKREEAQKQADEILRQAEESVRAECLSLREKAGKQEESRSQNAHSSAAMAARGRLLAERRKLIEEALEQTKQRLLQLPDDTYFQMVLRWIGASAEMGRSGELFFNQKDSERLPADFLEKLHHQPGCENLSLSKENRPLDGGVLLVYGDIEVNLEIASQLEARREELEDQINRVLFAVGSDS